jgi:ApeA N-terminal domain 1
MLRAKRPAACAASIPGRPRTAVSLLSDFPSLVVQPGSYPCVVEHPNGQRLAAQLDLGAARSPQGEIFGWPGEERGGVRAFPQPAERFPLLKCDLRAGWEVLLVDATVQSRFPGRASLHASLAAAGHGISADPGQGFREVSVQITEGHRLFGRAPLTKVTFPRTMPESGKVDFSVEVDRDANATYSSDGTELRCRYWVQGSLADYRRFFVTTAPVFEMRNAASLTPVEWMTSHVLPLRELVTLATLEPQAVAWATLDGEHEGASTEGSTRSFQLYSRDIQQAPYAPTADPHEESRTLFIFPELPYSPVEMLRRWEDLRTAHSGFVRPLMQGLTEQLNPRARFLFLAQALEGLHAETVGEAPVPVEQHRAKRREVLRAVKDAGLDKQWADRWLDRYGRFSLAERLAQLLDAVRPDVERVADVGLVPGDIPEIRNRLSHGGEDYSWQALRPAMQVMSAIGAAHVLRMLDLPLDRLPMVFSQD